MTNNEKDLSDKSVSQNREIKFRAFVTDTGEMIYSHDRQTSYTFSMYISEWLVLEKFDNSIPRWKVYIHYTIMQRTGLYDKKWVRIFEGDIIKYDENEKLNFWVAWEIALIVYMPGRFSARMSPYTHYNSVNQNMLNEDFEDSVTVIWNIYNDNHLINETKKTREVNIQE